MASDREAAKKSVVKTADKDDELVGALGAANKFQIELVKEQNRHIEEQTKKHLGWFGSLLGGEANAPIVVAAIASLLGFIFAGFCLALAYNDPENNDFYSDWSSAAFAITTTSLGFIFGKRMK